MKVAAAQFIYESNTFNDRTAGLEVFTRDGTWLTDDSAVRRWCRTADSQLSGSLDVLESAGCAVNPVFAAMCGTPAGRLDAACFAAIRSALRDSLRRALPADVLLLHLHGAACAEGEDDVEGNLLEMVRNELGYSGRLVVSLDLHANVTRSMLACADAVTAFRTMPHCDFRETGARAAGLALDTRPTTRALAKMAAIIPPTDTDHRAGRFADILRLAREAESEPGVLDVSVYPVQPWMDVAEMGSSVVVTSLPGAPATALAGDIGEAGYAQREAWASGLSSWDDIRARLNEPAAHPWILVDTADATTGGASGASAEAVARLWDLRDSLPGEVLLWVVDAAACAAARTGGRSFRLGQQQVEVEADVVFKGEGRFRARGKAYTGQEFSFGPIAVLAAGELRIMVSSRGIIAPDPAFYECAGLDPDHALAVQVKSHLGWRAGYGAENDQGLLFDGPGCTSLDFSRLPFTGARRLLFPVTAPPPEPISLWRSS